MKDTLKAGDYYNITPVSWVGFEVTTNGNTFAYVGKNQTNLSTANASFTFVPQVTAHGALETSFGGDS